MPTAKQAFFAGGRVGRGVDHESIIGSLGSIHGELAGPAARRAGAVGGAVVYKLEVGVAANNTLLPVELAWRRGRASDYAPRASRVYLN